MNKEEYMKEAQGLLDFIDASPSCFHAVDNIRKELEGCKDRKGNKDHGGYTELKESEDWDLKAGKGYYVTRNASSIIAFRMPKSLKADEIKGFSIAAAHSDSPALKIKNDGEIILEDKYLKLNVEKYGGMLMAPWLDRPLSIAGRVYIQGRKGIEERLINIDRDLLIIPNVAIHMNRDVNDGYKWSVKTDMQPLMCATTPDGRPEKGVLNRLIAKAAGVKEDKILSTDLFLYPRVKPAFLGADNEMIAARALDDLECAYALVSGLLYSDDKDRRESRELNTMHENVRKKNNVNGNNLKASIPLCCIFDNEETGSLSRQGADSDFLHDVLYRIAACLRQYNIKTDKAGNLNKKSLADKEALIDYAKNESGEDTNITLMKLLARSIMISADNAHALHPNHPEYADATDRPVLNGGVVIKFNAAQKYTTDAYSYALIKDLAKKTDVPLQTYSNRPDIAGGSTLGNLSGRHVSIPSVDIGLAQLAMHSCYETAGTYDVGYLTKLITGFFVE